jgi:hypothetical protein
MIGVIEWLIAGCLRRTDDSGFQSPRLVAREPAVAPHLRDKRMKIGPGGIAQPQLRLPQSQGRLHILLTMKIVELHVGLDCVGGKPFRSGVAAP